ncbi:MAG: FecR family protein [Bacteroidales bacterium]|nr:FecR family protein [Bacteroidales bacterium]
MKRNRILLLRYIEQKANYKEIIKVKKWASRSKKNRKELEAMKKMYISSKEIMVENNIDLKKSWNRLRAKTVDKKIHLLFRKYSRVAAVLLPIIFLSSIFLILHQETEYVSIPFDKNNVYVEFPDGLKYNLETDIHHPEYGEFKNNTLLNSDIIELKIVTPQDKGFNLSLSDGTNIELNKSTELSYFNKFDNEKREITLVGEAFLKVAKNKKPFIVKTKTANIKVLGTHFNVKADSSKLMVTLTEGSIEINNKNYKEIIYPGQQAVCYSNKMKVSMVDSNLYTIWAKDLIEFNNISLEKLCRYIEIWHNINFEFSKEELRARKLSGSLKRSTSLKRLFSIIETSLNIHIEKKDNIYILSNK